MIDPVLRELFRTKVKLLLLELYADSKEAPGQIQPLTPEEVIKLFEVELKKMKRAVKDLRGNQ